MTSFLLQNDATTQRQSVDGRPRFKLLNLRLTTSVIESHESQQVGLQTYMKTEGQVQNEDEKKPTKTFQFKL